MILVSSFKFRIFYDSIKPCNRLIYISLFLRRGSPALPTSSWKSAYCRFLRETSTALSFLLNFPSQVKNKNCFTELCPGRVVLRQFGAKKVIVTASCLLNTNIKPFFYLFAWETKVFQKMSDHVSVIWNYTKQEKWIMMSFLFRKLIFVYCFPLEIIISPLLLLFKITLGLAWFLGEFPVFMSCLARPHPKSALVRALVHSELA